MAHHSFSTRMVKQPRSYQVSLKDTALTQNTIVFLGTGSGKTFICVLLIKDMIADLMMREKEKPKLAIPKGPTVALDEVFAKKTSKTFFFLVDRVPLVFQQAEVIEVHTDLRVGKFCGEMGVDFWDRARWRKQLATYDVIVMTAQIMLNILRHGFVSLSEAALLVFDECHHALKSHPFNLIMQEFYFAPWTDISERPRIFGMTASPVKAGLSKTAGTLYTDIITTLEKNLHSKVAMIPESMQEDIEKYVPRPKEYFVKFEPPRTFGKDALWVTECAARFSGAVMTETELARYEIGERAALDYLDHRLEALLKDQIMHAQDEVHHQTPPQGQSTADLLSDETTPALPRVSSTNASPAAITAFRERLRSFRASIDPADIITPKLRKLKALLYESSQKSVATTGFRALVFVHRRFMAKFIHIELEKLVPQLKIGLIVGHGNGRNNDDDIAMGFKEQNEALVAFRAGLTNVLVCTSVVEEGLDVPECELVVLFDGVSSMTGYVQSRGRARHNKSMYVVFVQAGSDDELQLCTAHVGERLMESSVSDLQRDEEPIDTDDDDAVDEDWGKVFRIVSTGAIATHLSANEQLARYCNNLPHDIFCSMSPEYDFEYSVEDDKVMRARVVLPSTSAVPTATGDWVVGKRKAIQSAALHAVVALYEANALTDYLLPNLSVKNNSKYRKKMKRAEAYVQERLVIDTDDGSDSPYLRLLHGVASILRDPPVFDGDVSTMHMYTIEMEKEIPIDIRDRQASSSDAQWGSLGIVVPLPPIGILLREPLNHTPQPFMHYARPCGRLRTIIVNRDPISVTKDQYSAASKFQEYWVSIGTCSYTDNKQNKEVKEVEIEEEELVDVGPILTSEPPAAMAANKDVVVAAVGQPDTGSKEVWSAAKAEPLEDVMYKTRHGQQIVRTKNTVNTVNVPKSYLLVPLDRESLDIDWRMMDSVVLATINPPNPERITADQWHSWIGLESDNDELDSFMASTGHCLTSVPLELRSAVVVTEKSNTLYRVVRVRSDVTPAAAYETDSMQPMLEVVHVLRHPPDLHCPVVIRDESDIESSVLPTRHLLIPEAVSLLRVPAPVGLQEAALCLPSVMTDFERWALTNELRMSTGMDVGDSMLVKALTAVTSHSTLNYEKMETFGDTILKYVTSLHVFLHHPTKHQGNLTVLKEVLNTNQALVRAVLRRNLAPFLSVIPQQSTDWTPAVCTTHKVTVKSKMLADTLEALIGAAFLCRDREYIEQVHQPAELDFRKSIKYDRGARKTYIDGHGQWPGNDDDESDRDTWRMRPTKRFRTQPGRVLDDAMGSVSQFMAWSGILPPEEERITVDDYIRRFVPHEPYSTRLQQLIMLVAPVQDIIGYNFKNPALLVEAFTHGSITGSPTQCYQRLEWLGDAALDFLITRYLWFEYPDISPLEMSDMRQNLCTNEHFARVVIELGLHRFILHHSPPLMGAITDALHQLQGIKLRKNAGETVDLFEITAPKVIGDVLESLAGAVLLDSDHDVLFQVFWKLLEPHMIPSDHIVLAPLRRASRRGRALDPESSRPIRFETLENEQCTNNKNRVVVAMYFRDQLIATGESKNIRLARRMAAINSLQIEDWGVDERREKGGHRLGGADVMFTDLQSVALNVEIGNQMVTTVHVMAKDDEMRSGWD